MTDLVDLKPGYWSSRTPLSVAGYRHGEDDRPPHRQHCAPSSSFRSHRTASSICSGLICGRHRLRRSSARVDHIQSAVSEVWHVSLLAATWRTSMFWRRSSSPWRAIPNGTTNVFTRRTCGLHQSRVQKLQSAHQGWICDKPGTVEIGRSPLDSRAAAAIAGSGSRIGGTVW